jgi:hypothetical protein
VVPRLCVSSAPLDTYNAQLSEETTVTTILPSPRILPGKLDWKMELWLLRAQAPPHREFAVFLRSRNPHCLAEPGTEQRLGPRADGALGEGWPGECWRQHRAGWEPLMLSLFWGCPFPMAISSLLQPLLVNQCTLT